MRNAISAAVGLLWGGLILASWLARGELGEGDYRRGQYVGLTIGLLLFGGGAYYLYRAVDEFRAPRGRTRRGEGSDPASPTNKHRPGAASKAPSPAKRRPPEPPGGSGGLPPRTGR